MLETQAASMEARWERELERRLLIADGQGLSKTQIDELHFILHELSVEWANLVRPVLHATAEDQELRKMIEGFNGKLKNWYSNLMEV